MTRSKDEKIAFVKKAIFDCALGGSGAVDAEELLELCCGNELAAADFVDYWGEFSSSLCAGWLDYDHLSGIKAESFDEFMTKHNLPTHDKRTNS